MNNIQKNIIKKCELIWGKRVGKGVWLDSERETDESPENLVYKRLDGLRAILLPVSRKKLSFVDYTFLDKEEFFEEIVSLLEYLTRDGGNFYPAPHTYTPMAQPDDYIDMAAHSLSFSTYCLNINKKNSFNKLTRDLAWKSLNLIVKDNNFFFDAESCTAAWAGTTIYKNGGEFDLLKIYFTSQVVNALGDWIGSDFCSDPDVEVALKERVKILILAGCRWILNQANNPQKILPGKHIHEIITANIEGLNACFDQWTWLGSGEKNRALGLAHKFVEFISNPENRPTEDNTWYHHVLTKNVGPQFYADRQDNHGIVYFLSCAAQRLPIEVKPKIEELAEIFMEEYLQGDHTVHESFIGSLPWYVKDLLAAAETFPGLQDTVTVNIGAIRKCLKNTFLNEAILDSIARDLYSKLINFVQADQFSKIDNKPSGSKRK